MPTENRPKVARREESCGMGEKGDGTEKYRWAVTEQSQDGKCSTGSVVTDMVITMCRAKWALKISGGSLCKVCDCLTTVKLIQKNIDCKL